MKKTVFYALLFCLSAAVNADETAEDIIQRARTNTEIKSIGTRAKMEIQKDGVTLNELVIDQFTAKAGENTRRTFMEFKAPANVKGTRFLMIADSSGTVDQRIYLPALGKIRRITGIADGTQSFMGTDFSYNDIAYMERDVNLDTYRKEVDEVYQGVPCHVIEATPKDRSSEYSKTRVWIEKDSNNFVRTEFYDRNGKLVKVIEISSYKMIQGINTPMQTKMTTLSTGTSTVIHILKMQYNMKIPAKVFTPRYLEHGK